jgi:aspartate carbamoyltransferase catalytic subunit
VLTSRGVVFEEHTDLSQALASTDVLYVTRVQKVSSPVARWAGKRVSVQARLHQAKGECIFADSPSPPNAISR